MNTHIEILLRLIIYVFARFQLGQRFTSREKHELLSGLYKLSVDFFSKYMLNDELGSKWVEISTHDNICISDETYIEDKEEVHELFQDAQICAPVSTMQR
jgi:hypothetical protein